MKNKYFLLFFLIVIGSLTYKFTFSYFSDTGSSSDNILSASATFPTLTPTSTPAITSTPTPTPTIQAGDIVINEINWAGNNTKAEDEWIELRNMTSRSINLTGWKIENFGSGTSSATLTIASGSIPPNGLFLIAQYDEDNSNSRLNVHPDLIDPTPDINLHNDGELLTLKSDTGATIDIANRNDDWYEGVNTPEPKKSMERKDPPDDGTVSTNWQTAATHTGMDESTSSAEFGTPKNPNGL